MPEYPLTVELARAYFEKHKDEVCGFGLSSASCPLSNALSDAYAPLGGITDGEAYQIWGEHALVQEWIDLPAWASAFVALIDDRTPHGEEYAFTGAECLAILEEIDA
jgi:hypothetical protein